MPRTGMIDYIGGLANTALKRCRRMKRSGGYLVYAGATDEDIGTLSLDKLTTTVEAVDVIPRNAVGEVEMVAAGAISQYANVYAAADGKVASTGTILVGEAQEAATADGDLILVQRLVNSQTATTVPLSIPLTEARITGSTNVRRINLPLTDARATGTGALLGASAGTPSGALGLTVGSHGSASPILASEAANNSSVTNKCRFVTWLPQDYQAGQAVTLRVHARITGDVAVSQTIDATVYEGDTEAGVSSDLCATAAQTLTSAFANYDFTVTPTALGPGDILDIELTAVADDTGGSANKLIQIGAVELRVTEPAAMLGPVAGSPSGAMGITMGAHGTATPILISEAANGTSVSNKCRFLVELPPEYVASESVTLRVRAKITGDVEVAQTIDAAVYEGDTEGGVGDDLCATAAQTLTDEFANYDFTITDAGLTAGDILDIELTAAADDTGGTANKLIQIGAVSLRAGCLV